MKKFQKKTGRVLRTLGCCAMMLALGLPCVAESQTQEVPELLEPVGVKMDTVAAYIGEIKRITVYEGAVAPRVEEIYFNVDGTVEEVNVIIGQKVKEGDVLITLNQESQERELESLLEQVERHEQSGVYDDALAQIDLSILETELTALMNQVPRNDEAIALKKLDIEQKKLDMELTAELRALGSRRLQERIALLETEMVDNALYAPFDGTIIYGSQLQRGSRVSAYTPVLYIADDSDLKIETQYINSTDHAHALYALVGDKRYDVTQIPLDNKEYISRMLAGETVMSQFVVNEPDEGIVPGAYAALCVESQYVPDALLVPSNAIYADASGKYVYVVEDGERVRTSVETGVVSDWETQIVEGIEEGAVVYVKD